MQIAVPGHFLQQYSLEEVETDVKGVHPSARVTLEEETTGEDTLIPLMCTIELRGKEATAETIQHVLRDLAGLESVVWKQDIGSEAILQSVDNLDFVQDQLLQFGIHTQQVEQQIGQITRNLGRGTLPQTQMSPSLGQRIGDAVIYNKSNDTSHKPVDEHEL